MKAYSAPTVTELGDLGALTLATIHKTTTAGTDTVVYTNKKTHKTHTTTIPGSVIGIS